jgi:hypothetical protein
MCPVLGRRIDRIRGNRNGEEGVDAVVGEKWTFWDIQKVISKQKVILECKRT